MIESIAQPMKKSGEVEFPVNQLIQQRRSRRAYADKPVELEKINSLFEAARWAPSSSNEQPWVYLYATKEQPDLWNKIFDTLEIGNKIWAEKAPLLILAMNRKTFLRNDKPNGSARFDLGAANALLSIQATELGLNVHQMGGFERQKAIETLNIPETHEPTVVMAIGYPGDVEELPNDNLKERELAVRQRYTQEFFVMNKSF
ncbi:MAG: nitroreductase family protein [Cyclobacteriaceae bacterium]|nr:nitroreductase family protein [Cyclobacteriaceae bacterium]